LLDENSLGGNSAGKYGLFFARSNSLVVEKHQHILKLTFKTEHVFHEFKEHFLQRGLLLAKQVFQ